MGCLMFIYGKYHLRRLVLVLLIAIFILSSCASLNEKECQTANWRLIGYEDGAAGKSTVQLKEHREACAEYRITPDLETYRLGHDEGLREYCRPANAYQLAKNGKSYPRLCHVEKEVELRAAYREGRKVYDLLSDIGLTKQRLSSKQRELKEIEETLFDYQAEIIKKGISNERRLQLLTETIVLSKREDVIHGEIADLEQHLYARKKYLSKLESGQVY